MKKSANILAGFLALATLVLEALPYGAVLNFANPEGEPFRSTFSYFDLTPLGYANAGPFITAILTCFLLLFSVILLITGKKALRKASLVLSLVATGTSLLPLMFGLAYYGVISGIISVLLIIQAVVLYRGRAE